jgi:diguanylate cyclase (GGDEF)-like protein
MEGRRKSDRQPEPDEAPAPGGYHAAVRDPLTGVYVRQYFNEFLLRECAFASRHGSLLSVILVQVDALDALKTQWGPKAAEVVLAGVAGKMRGTLRAEDMIANWDEGTFALILRDVDTGTASIVAERLRRTVAAAKDLFDGFPVRPTVSVGLATTHLDPGGRPTDLVAGALGNLKRAADAGGNRVVPGL